MQGNWLREENDLPTEFYSVPSGNAISLSESTNANLVLRLLPTFVMNFVSMSYIVPIVTRLCNTQCWLDLAAGPRPAIDSLGLEYTTLPSFLVPVVAIENKHYALVVASIISAVAPFCAIFAAGLFLFERTSDDIVHIVYSKPAFIMVSIYVALYITILLLAWPSRRALLLRPMLTLLDCVRPFTCSSLARNHAVLRAAEETTRERFRARILLEDFLIQLGVSSQVCGFRHLGAEIVGTSSKTMYAPAYESADNLIKQQRAHRTGLRRRQRHADPYGDAGESVAPVVPNTSDEVENA